VRGSGGKRRIWRGVIDGMCGGGKREEGEDVEMEEKLLSEVPAVC
jgi:hypothetical protein